MFGGIGVYANDRMCVSLSDVGLAVKLSGGAHAALLEINGAKPLQYEPSSPPSKTYVVVPAAMLTDRKALGGWLALCAAQAAAAPAKKPGKTTQKPRPREGRVAVNAALSPGGLGPPRLLGVWPCRTRPSHPSCRACGASRAARPLSWRCLGSRCSSLTVGLRLSGAAHRPHHADLDRQCRRGGEPAPARSPRLARDHRDRGARQLRGRHDRSATSRSTRVGLSLRQQPWKS